MADRATFRGKYLAHACGSRLELFECDGARLRSLGTGEAPGDAAFLQVAASAPWVVGRDASHATVWQWRPGEPARVLAQREGRGDHAIGSLVEIEGATYAALSRRGQLQLFDFGGAVRHALAQDRPRPWATHGFAALPGGRVAVLGNEPDEPWDRLLVLDARALLDGPDALERALATAVATWGGAATSDRAIALVAGPGPGSTMLVVRDPDGEEEPDADLEPEETPDIYGLHGAYLRDLATGALLERFDWPVELQKLAACAATDRFLALETAAGVLVRSRATGTIDTIAGGVLDPLGARCAIPDGTGWRLHPL